MNKFDYIYQKCQRSVNLVRTFSPSFAQDFSSSRELDSKSLNVNNDVKLYIPANSSWVHFPDLFSSASCIIVKDAQTLINNSRFIDALVQNGYSQKPCRVILSINDSSWASVYNEIFTICSGSGLAVFSMSEFETFNADDNPLCT